MPTAGSLQSAASPRRRAWARSGFGFWVIAVVIILLLLAVAGGASQLQNRQLYRSIVETHLGRIAVNIARSAVAEAYHRLSHHLLSPVVDDTVTQDWDALLVGIPDDSSPTETLAPEVTRRVFAAESARSGEFTIVEIGDVVLTLVHRELDFARGFTCGVLELATLVRLRQGGIAGVEVARRLKVRKRFYATQVSATQSPRLRFMSEDVSREVLRQ